MPYPSDETMRMLHSIRDCAFTIETRARWVKVDVEIIQKRPDWPTKAEEELERAMMHLQAATAMVHSALRRLKEKPIEPRTTTDAGCGQAIIEPWKEG